MVETAQRSGLPYEIFKLGPLRLMTISAHVVWGLCEEVTFGRVNLSFLKESVRPDGSVKFWAWSESRRYEWLVGAMDGGIPSRPAAINRDSVKLARCRIDCPAISQYEAVGGMTDFNEMRDQVTWESVWQAGRSEHFEPRAKCDHRQYALFHNPYGLCFLKGGRLP